MVTRLKNHHKHFVKEKKKNQFSMPKKGTPKTPDLEELSQIVPAKPGVVMTVTMKGCRWIHIENYNYIADYKENVIKIMGKQQLLVVEGCHLSILYFTEDDILIEGRIYKVYYS